MKDIDFKICEFIKEQMYFLTYLDFCNRRKIIKEMFEKFNRQEKLFYKWYLYSNIHMTEHFKNAIWDYLNGFDENGFELMRMKHFYKVK